MGKCARRSVWCHRRTFARRGRSGGCSRVSTEHGFQRNAVVPCLYWSATLEALGVHCHLRNPDNRADDLEQLIREVFKVKICERISRGVPAQESGMER